MAAYALGFRVKSGHAIAVALRGPVQSPVPLARVSVALSDPSIQATKQPYHAGFGTAREDRTEVARLVAIVERCARHSIAALLTDDRLASSSCHGAALVVGSVIDPEQVGNPHIRAHAHEGRLFRTVLEDALRANHVRCSVFVEKALAGEAAKHLKRPAADVKRVVGGFARALGGPWRSEEKAAATAAWIALG